MEVFCSVKIRLWIPGQGCECNTWHSPPFFMFLDPMKSYPVSKMASNAIIFSIWYLYAHESWEDLCIYFEILIFKATSAHRCQSLSSKPGGGLLGQKVYPLLGQQRKTPTKICQTLPLLAQNLGPNPYPPWHKSTKKKKGYPPWNNWC